MTRFSRLLVKTIWLLMMVLSPITAKAASLNAADWESYRASFLDPSGRIIDTANNNISHSEGQGYGMWLAVLADDVSNFELIWSFTKTELLVRDDGLAAWKWDPQANPHVSDINNATDGDILIAYALSLAARQWGRQDYASAAQAIAQAVLDKTVIERGGRTLLLPGTTGFAETERPDGPIINQSYYIFEAFPALNELVPSPLWGRLTADGLAAITNHAFGDRKLPADWISVKTRARPADGFPQEFGYNSVRIPLYLARAGVGTPELYDRLSRGMSLETGNVATFDLRTGAAKDVLSDPGYRVIPALLACVSKRTPIPQDLKSYASTLYYPSTLHLLALSFVAQTNQECL
ncbi:glycosyl hydrolase family 8 [Agrobacterium larrymoorei]|uniref:cellulase n=1 Tax=Agrobacterium larrymoorei TaxID=160699 RepID=A0A4D7DY25_9HYPH|nr:glycosyl hydrolase family 8 [Agrobacterium larrymoorei]QCJ00135.1 endoglucanase [Agrobacterium larrymoorei]QYA09422.1 endoglucanase [Agrobacterium larrymoorei]